MPDASFKDKAKDHEGDEGTDLGQDHDCCSCRRYRLVTCPYKTPTSCRDLSLTTWPACIKLSLSLVRAHQTTAWIRPASQLASQRPTLIRHPRRDPSFIDNDVFTDKGCLCYLLLVSPSPPLLSILNNLGKQPQRGRGVRRSSSSSPCNNAANTSSFIAYLFPSSQP